MTALLGAVFVASLAGSLHCAGMCGPLVAFYSGADASHGLARSITHAVYNGGRLAGYLVLGAVAGVVVEMYSAGGSVSEVGRVALVG